MRRDTKYYLVTLTSPSGEKWNKEWGNKKTALACYTHETEAVKYDAYKQFPRGTTVELFEVNVKTTLDKLK